MSERQEILVTNIPEIIKMPLIKGDYFTHDIGLFISHGGVHIFEKEYREVKCGKGTRKMREHDDSIDIPFEILDIFIEALQKLKKQ